MAVRGLPFRLGMSRRVPSTDVRRRRQRNLPFEQRRFGEPVPRDTHPAEGRRNGSRSLSERTRRGRAAVASVLDPRREAYPHYWWITPFFSTESHRLLLTYPYICNIIYRSFGNFSDIVDDGWLTIQEKGQYTSGFYKLCDGVCREGQDAVWGLRRRGSVAFGSASASRQPGKQRPDRFAESFAWTRSQGPDSHVSFERGGGTWGLRLKGCPPEGRAPQATGGRLQHVAL